MEMCTEVFADGGLDTKDAKFPAARKGMGFRVGIAFLRNVKPIEKGEALTLPAEEECGCFCVRGSQTRPNLRMVSAQNVVGDATWRLRRGCMDVA